MKRVHERFVVAVLCLTLSNTPALGVAAEPVYGDLTHLTFSATGPLRTSFIAPLPQSAASGPATSVEVATGLGGGVELRINGETVSFAKIGRRGIDEKAGETRYTYYGIPLQPGPNLLEATPLGAGGSRGATISEHVFGPGRPARFDVTLQGSLRADGRTARTLRIAAFDRWNHAALPGSVVRITIAEGDAHFAPIAHSQGAPKSEPGAAPELPRAAGDTVNSALALELTLGDDGTLDVPVVPGLRSGTLRVTATARGAANGEGDFFIHPNLRAPLVTGLVTTGFGQVPSTPGEQPNAPSGSNSRRGRFALYATGEVARNTLGTFAYDSADVLQSSTTGGPYVADPNDRRYSTYGDSSVLRNDALSRDHLYLRLDNDRNNAMWGEFQAQTGGRDGLGGFNLLVAGTKIELAGERSKLTAFNARNDVAYARQIYAASGLSTLPQLLHPEIVIGSETIVLVALDRRTGLAVSQTTLTRNVDYALDYSTGFLRFINIPLPFDDRFNPQQVLVQYEYAGTGVDAQTSGGRFETALGAGQKTHLGVGYVNDASGAGNFALFGQDLSGVLPGGTWSLGHLSSQGILAGTTSFASASGGSGEAYRATLAQTSGANHLALGFDWSSAEFSNPFGGFSTPGLLDYHASYTHAFEHRKGEVAFTFDHEQNATPGYAAVQTSLGVKARSELTKRLSVTAGITTQSGPLASTSLATATSDAVTTTVTGTTTQAQLGFDWKLFTNAALSLNRTSDIGGAASSTTPGQTSAQFSVDFPKKGRVYVRELWSDAPTQSFAASTSGLTSAALATHSTAIGVERLVGKATTLDSEYVLERTGNGSDIYSAMGVKQHFDFNQRMTGDAFVQHATAVGENLSGFNVYGVSASYAEGSRFRGTTSYQIRTGDSPGSTWALGLGGALSNDLSLQATLNTSRSGGTFYDDSRLGLAWRPSEHDRGATLLEYERKDGTLEPLATHAEILSIEHVYRPSNRLELAGRYAYKLDGDSYYPAQTSLVGLRARQSIGSRFDLGGEMSYLDAQHLPGAQQAGFAAEAGYSLGDTIRVAVGYTFAGSADPSLSAAPTRRGVYVTATSVVDRIFGWGKSLGFGGRGSAK